MRGAAARSERGSNSGMPHRVKLSRDADPGHDDYLRARPLRYRGFKRTSRYLEMRDGVRIAVDICLPRGLAAGERVPAMIRQTRYFRRFRLQPALKPLLGQETLDPMNASMRRLFTSRGYAWIDVDARGSGASFGERPCPWWLDGEVADGAEIAEFVTKQPWSNGRVGSTGVSYDGTTAEFLAITAHPAVRAVAPRFSLFDAYADVAFPGGLHNSYFTQAWESANAALDCNAPGEMVALIYMLQTHGMLDPRLARRLDRPAISGLLSRIANFGLAGVAPVDGDRGARLLVEALASHSNNFNVHEGALETTFRDDSPPSAPLAGHTVDNFSPHSYVDRLKDVAVLSYGGWFDGGYAGSALARHAALTARGIDSRLLIGPWIHGGQLDMDPDAPGRHAAFDHAAELLRFFDGELWPEQAPGREQPRVRWFEMGAGSWRESPSWPPPGTRAESFHLAPGRRLAREPAGADATDAAEMDLSVGSGKRTRWRTLLCPYLHADGKGRSDHGYLVYESAPLELDLVIAGHPLLVLSLRSSASDGAIVAYLGDVTAGGEARLVSEGALRMLHGTRLVDGADALPRREASFLRKDARGLLPGQTASHVVELVPTGMRLRAGHRLRLSLGAADVDHFTTPPAPDGVRWEIDLSASRLILPVAG